MFVIIFDHVTIQSDFLKALFELAEEVMDHSSFILCSTIKSSH